MALRESVFHIDQDRGVLIASGRPFENPVASLPSRRRALSRCLKKHMKAAPYVTESGEGSVVRLQAPLAHADAFRQFVDRLEAKIHEIMFEPLVPGDVEHLLGISARERIRWGKDGRLAKSGVGSIRKGDQVIHYAKHPAGTVMLLMIRPEVIEEWRQRDRQAGL